MVPHHWVVLRNRFCNTFIAAIHYVISWSAQVKNVIECHRHHMNCYIRVFVLLKYLLLEGMTWHSLLASATLITSLAQL